MRNSLDDLHLLTLDLRVAGGLPDIRPTGSKAKGPGRKATRAEHQRGDIGPFDALASVARDLASQIPECSTADPDVLPTLAEIVGAG